MTKFQFKPDINKLAPLLLKTVLDANGNYQFTDSEDADIVIQLGKSNNDKKTSINLNKTNILSTDKKPNAQVIGLIRNYFSFLTIMPSKSGGTFLTKEQLEQFIERAFLGREDLPKIRFNAVQGEYNQIVYYFYMFYTICINSEDSAKKRGEIKEAYKKLLIDNFTNFGKLEHVYKNFHRGPSGKLIVPYRVTPYQTLDSLENISFT